MASRIAEAYVQVVPRIDGIGSSLTKGLSNELGETGEKAGSSFKTKFMGVTKNIAGPLIAAFGTAAVFGFAKQGVDAAAAFDKGLREVVTLTSLTGDAAEEAFQGFSNSVKALSGDLGIATDTLTTGLYNAISAGVPTDNVFTFLEVAGKAAIGGVTDVNTAVDGLTTVLNAFGLEATEVTAVSDSLFAAVQGGKTTFGELSASLFNVGPAAAAAGVSFQEVNAAIATLTAAGVPTSVATTQIRAALVGLQRPSKELDAIFQALGFDSAQLALEQEGLGFALAAVKDASGGSNGALQQLLGSVEAVGAANVIAGTGAAKYASELERQANAVGATGLAFDEIEKARTFEILQNDMNLLQLEIGQALLPILVDLATFFKDSVLPVITSVFTFLKDNNGVIYAIAAALGVMAAAWLGMTIAASPWLLIGAAIAAGIAALILVFTNWGKIVEFVKGGINAAMKFLEGVFTNFGTFFENLWTGIGDFFKGIVNGYIAIWQNLINFILDGVNSITAAISSISFDVPSWVPVVGGKKIGVQIPPVKKVKLPKLADGGFVDQATTAIIGEAGPEVVTPLRDFERMMGLDEKGASKVINYYAAENKSIDSEQALLQAIKRAKVITGW
jgi:TP901 family phage tail tape measure protein